MTTMMDPAPELLTDVLRGDRARRPRRDDVSAAGLRALLEDHVFAVCGAPRSPHAVVISSATLASAGSVRALADSSLGRAKGTLVATLLRLLVARFPVRDPYADALSAWRGEHPHDHLLDVVAHLDDDQQARLRADVRAHASTLTRIVGTVPSSWRPRTSQRVRQSFGGGHVHLSDVIDLVVGSAHGEVANVALVDLTTSPLGPGAERAMRYHALMQTLRSSVVPLRTSIFSSATGELWTRDVDHELLLRAVDDVARVLDHVRGTSS